MLAKYGKCLELGFSSKKCRNSFFIRLSQMVVGQVCMRIFDSSLTLQTCKKTLKKV